MTSAKSQSQHQKTFVGITKNNAGRNSQGKITYRHQGGHKRAYRVIDFKRNKDNVEGRRSLNRVRSKPYSNTIIHYADGVKAYNYVR